MSKYAVVTGAGRGIGSAIAIRLAQDGYDILVNYARSKDRAEALAAEITEKYGVKALACQADVSKYDDMKAMYDFAIENFGDECGVLVNNAGFTNWKPFLEMTVEEYTNGISVDLLGAMHGTSLFAPLMVKHKFGRIINISSTAGLQGSPGMVDYSAAKGGLNAMAKALTLELGQFNVYANAICPGFIKTEGTAVLGPELIERCKEGSPMKNVGEVEEVAEIVAFLVKNPILGGQSLAPNYGQFML